MPLIPSEFSHNAMAKAFHVVPGRLHAVTAPRKQLTQTGFRRLSSLSNSRRIPTSDFRREPSSSISCIFYIPPTCRSSWLASFSSCQTSRSAVTLHQKCTSQQIRRYASQTDGLGQTDTFRGYRIRQEIEQRRRVLRELEHDLLRSEIEVSDARLQLNLRELAGLPDAPPTPAHTTTTNATTPPTTILPTALLKSLTPHENIYTIPNMLTFSRLLAAPLVGYAILTTQPTLALSLFAYAGVTDAVDGYLARRYNQTTVVGTVIDPMADKLLMTIAVVCLAVQGTIPPWLAVVVIGRDVCLAISAIYFRYISLPPPKTFARYWDFSLPSAEVHPTEISKINTLLQLLLIGSAMALPVLRESLPLVVEAWNLGGVFEGWSYLVGATTVWSGLSYIGNKDAVKILGREKEPEEKEMEVKDLGPLYRNK